MQRARRATQEQRHEPVRDRGEDQRNGPEREPDDVRDGEQQPEEDSRARAAQLVRVADQPYRMQGRTVDTCEHRRRVGVRVAVGDEEDVRPRLRAVPDRVRGGVAQPLRSSPTDDAREPCEDRARERQRPAAAGGVATLAARRQAKTA